MTLPQPAPIEHGARIELRLEKLSSNEVVYSARWFLGHSESIAGHVSIAVQPHVEVSVESASQLPDWVLKFTSLLVRTTARSSTSAGWPRRLTRWRECPSHDG